MCAVVLLKVTSVTAMGVWALPLVMLVTLVTLVTLVGLECVGSPTTTPSARMVLVLGEGAI